MANFEKDGDVIRQPEPKKQSPVLETLNKIERLFDELAKVTRELDERLKFVSVDRPNVERYPNNTAPDTQGEPVSTLESSLIGIQSSLEQEIGWIGVLIHRLNI